MVDKDRPAPPPDNNKILQEILATLQGIATTLTSIEKLLFDVKKLAVTVDKPIKQ